MTRLPFRRGAFDYVLAWNVIYHGDRAALENALREITRVLRTGALLQATCLSKRQASFGRGQRVRRDTYIDLDHPEKAHPHHYLDERCLRALLYEHSLWPLAVSERVDTYHWHILAERAR